ncbi:hypothetical protein R3P38DRAFT_598694 [Favolaschia claudopus]|uniref:Uncharacterized protein n=1 Tax=Favolaschia claudopus TaxID=2862362 RepID=A0AAV9Z8A9_9AGAR
MLQAMRSLAILLKIAVRSEAANLILGCGTTENRRTPVTQYSGTEYRSSELFNPLSDTVLLDLPTVRIRPHFSWTDPTRLACKISIPIKDFVHQNFWTEKGKRRVKCAAEINTSILHGARSLALDAMGRSESSKATASSCSNSEISRTVKTGRNSMAATINSIDRHALDGSINRYRFGLLKLLNSHACLTSFFQWFGTYTYYIYGHYPLSVFRAGT